MDTASEHDAQGAATLRRFYLLIPVCTRNLIPTSQVSSGGQTHSLYVAQTISGSVLS